MQLITMLSPSAGLPLAVNVLAIGCACGVRFAWASNISLVRCPGCGLEELWHDVAPKPPEGMWSEPVMQRF